MPSIHLDPSDFAAVIDRAVDAAIRRHSAQRHCDEVGKILVDKRTAANMLSTSEATVDRLRAKHGLPAIKLNDGKVWFRPAALEAWALKQEGMGN